MKEATGFQGAVARQRDKLALAEHLQLDGIAGVCPVCEAPSQRGRENGGRPSGDADQGAG